MTITPSARVVNVSDRAFLMHVGGKIGIHDKVPVKTRDDFPTVFDKKVAPAVAREVMKAAQNGGVARRRRWTARA